MTFRGSYLAVLTLLVGLGLSGASGPRTVAPTVLTGARKVVERSYQCGDSSWVNRSPEVGRYVFTERYYGVQEIREPGPRPDFTDTTTELQRLTAFDVPHAHGGPYEIVGERLVITIDIAKSPNTMSGEAPFEYQLEFSGDQVRVVRAVQGENVLRRCDV